jgi:RNA 2',3'-cyclic 3'-phosphodiesterase
MTGGASVDRGESVRLFCALRLPPAAAGELSLWQNRAFAGADVRVVAQSHLHVTLAFLGPRPATDLDRVTEALRAAASGVEPPKLAIERYRETRSVGMLVCGDAGGRATRIATVLHERLDAFGIYEREQREWLPHVSVTRFRQRPRLQPDLPELEPFVTSEAAVYMSVLRPSGAQYEVLQSVALEGS